MIGRGFKTRLALAPVMLCVALCASAGQNGGAPASAARPAQESSEQLFQVNRQRGWTIPGESQFTVPERTRTVVLEGRTVEVRSYRCAGDLPLTDVEFYYRRGNGQLHVKTLLLAVRNLSVASLNGRVFAYQLALVNVTVRPDGSRELGGAAVLLHYYDEDGDGRFEIRYGDLTSFKLPDRPAYNE